MVYFLTLLICLMIIGAFFGTSQIGGTGTPYLYRAQNALKAMFDHQLPYKTTNGSWLSVSFKNMHHFNKDEIWNTLRTIYTESEAETMHPHTYYLPSEAHLVPQGQLILKETHKWGREGLLVIPSEDIHKYKHKYNIAQPLLKNPDLINGYKYDIRMFLVVHHRHGILLYRRGYFSYSNHKYDYNADDMFSKIGGVHLTAKFYADNKLPTSTDTYPEYSKLYPKVESMLTNVFRAYPEPLLTPGEREHELIKIFGIDINFFKGKAVLIEMNSNPCLLFPEAEWKNVIIYNLVEDIRLENIGMFSKLKDI